MFPLVLSATRPDMTNPHTHKLPLFPSCHSMTCQYGCWEIGGLNLQGLFEEVDFMIKHF